MAIDEEVRITVPQAGASASSPRNCATTLSALQCGGITPALPMRMRVMRAAIAAIKISGALPVVVGRPSCSLTQKRE